MTDLKPADRKAMKALTRAGSSGLMLPEIAKKLGLQPHSVRARMSRLKNLGMVEVQTETPGGGGFRFYRLTVDGIRENRKPMP